MVKELVVGDIHDNMKVFENLDEILASTGVDRVMYVGDLSEGIPVQARGVFQQVAGMLEQVLDQKEKTGKLPSKEEQQELAEGMKQCNDILEKYGPQQYGMIDQAIGKLNEKHKVKSYFVPGNHDTKHVTGLKNATMLYGSGQPLKGENVIGVMHSVEGSATHFVTQNQHRLPADDHNELGQSYVHKAFQGTPVDLVLAHKGGMLGELKQYDKFSTGQGLPELEKKNTGTVEYCGHFHDGWVYRDPVTRTLSINPGTDHSMVVTRKGKKVTRIEIYELN